MFNYVKKLQYPINIKNPDARAAKVIITQYGGPDGRLILWRGKFDNYLSLLNISYPHKKYMQKRKNTSLTIGIFSLSALCQLRDMKYCAFSKPQLCIADFLILQMFQCSDTLGNMWVARLHFLYKCHIFA